MSASFATEILREGTGMREEKMVIGKMRLGLSAGSRETWSTGTGHVDHGRQSTSPGLYTEHDLYATNPHSVQRIVMKL